MSLDGGTPRKACIISYERAIKEDGSFHGCALLRLEECCNVFKRWILGCSFGTTYVSFNDNLPIRNSPEDGLRLVLRREAIEVELRTLSFGAGWPVPYTENRVRYCPFCGAKIELQETRAVMLKPKYRIVPNKYEKIVLSESSEVRNP